MQKQLSILIVTCAAALAALPVFAEAKVISEEVEYMHGDQVLLGYLAYDDAVDNPRPGVLIAHAWMGLDDYARMRADMLAEMGHVAFAADIYGKGIRPQNTEAASAEAGKYRNDPDLLRGRMQSALEILLATNMVDSERVAAIGYCFGGMAVLELARSGADVAGVVSFHGSLGTTKPAQAGDVKAKVLVLHGAADPHVPWEQVQALGQEMDTAGADWQLVAYSGAMHSFTEPGANSPERGSMYHEDADRRSWADMQQFFDEIFSQ